jgi:uncharacterized protein YndB with AHSA1/START domain
MPDIIHRVGINASPEKTFEALSTIDGLRHWWTTETSGSTQHGGIIDFGFCHMTVVESIPRERIHWRCTKGPEEWLGTEVVFQLLYKDSQTFVMFTHAQWKQPTEFMHHCSTKWAVFLLSLRDWLERNEGRPAPYDIKIHVRD